MCCVLFVFVVRSLLSLWVLPCFVLLFLVLGLAFLLFVIVCCLLLFVVLLVCCWLLLVVVVVVAVVVA